MSKQKNGGQAFPRAGFSGPRGFGTPELGMTLRDWFAGQALAGMVAGAHGSENSMSGLMATAEEAGVSVHVICARASYHYADALLAAREAGDAS